MKHCKDHNKVILPTVTSHNVNVMLSTYQLFYYLVGCDPLPVKVKWSCPILVSEHWAQSWSQCTVSPQMTLNHPPKVGCHYFPPGLQLPSQPKSDTAHRLVPNYIAWWKSTCVWAACPRLYLIADRPRFEPVTFWVASVRSTITPHRPCMPVASNIGYKLLFVYSYICCFI